MVTLVIFTRMLSNAIMAFLVISIKHIRQVECGENPNDSLAIIAVSPHSQITKNGDLSHVNLDDHHYHVTFEQEA